MRIQDLIKKIIRTALKTYLVFAIGHICVKAALISYFRYRVRKIWKNVPGWDFDMTATRLRKQIHNYHDYFADSCVAFPEADLIKLDMPVPFMIANTPKSIKWLLKDEFENISKPGPEDPTVHQLNRFLGSNGIFTLRHGQIFSEANEKWIKQRKVSSKIFTKSNFMTMFYDTFCEKAERVLNRLEKSDGKVLDLQEVFFSFTMDSIEKFFMGSEVNTVEGGMSEYAKNFDLAHNAMMRLVTHNAVPLILSIFVLPYPFGVLLPGKDPYGSLALKAVQYFSKDHQIFTKSVQNLNEHVQKYIDLTRKDPNIDKRKDIIANFLNSSIGDELTDEMLRDIVLNLTIAGRDTTACALSWMFFELTQYPDVQEKLIKEIDGQLKGKKPTLQDLEAGNLPYLNGVMYETLRLHPPVPNDQKTVYKHIRYHDGTWIPEGTQIFYSPLGFGRNPQRYPNPMKFDPNRWIPFVQPSLYEFPVFQAGPRFCLGKDMAQFEMKLLAVYILQKFRISLKEGESKKIGYSLQLTSSVAVDKERSVTELLCIPHKRFETSI